MTVLILFATVEGQSGKIARFAEKEVRESGQEVVLVDADELTDRVPFEGADKVILAAPVHERRHPKNFEMLVAANRNELEVRKTLLLSISLNAAFPEGYEEAKDYITELKMRTKFTPRMEAIVAGAVRTTSYDYFATRILQHVVLRGKNFDPSEGDHEFTDWDALSATISEFLSCP